jgi:ketopantoate reductase
MRVLVVGGGSVGATFGYALTRAGVEVDYFVKRTHADECMRGFRMFRIDRKGEQERFRARLVLTEWEDVAAAGPYDFVLVTVPSDALRGAWFDEMIDAVEHARVVLLQRGVGDDEWAAERAPRARLDRGVIGFWAYEAPLDGGSDVRLGTAFWIPPFSKTLFEASERGALEPLADALSRGGLPSAERSGIERQAVAGELLCMALVMALEPVGYHIDELARRKHLAARAIGATRESAEVLTALLDAAPPALFGKMSPMALTLGLKAARMVTPFPLESYLRVHFTKVRAQMERNRARLIDEGRRLSIATPMLEAAHLALSAEERAAPAEVSPAPLA